MREQNYMETARTILRNLETGDAEDFYTLNLDPEVIKYTGNIPFDSLEAATDFLANYNPYQKYGVGRMAVIEKATSKFIGWCGLKYSPEMQEYDIGFRFFRQYWNQGFATETAQKCLEQGFRELHIRQIVGRAMQENTASIQVLKKLSMTRKGTFDFDGQEGVMYSLTKTDYEKRILQE